MTAATPGDAAVPLHRARGPPWLEDSPRCYLVFDFETTGLDPARDRIIQVGLCEVSAGQVIQRSSWLVNQPVEVPPEAARIHGISTSDIRARGIPPRDSVQRVLAAMRQAPACIGHNIHRFDVPFLLAESRRHGFAAPDYQHYIDTAAIYKGRKLGLAPRPAESPRAYADRVFSIRAYGLRYAIPTCLAELGIDPGPARLHDASQDAYVTHLIFQALQATRPIADCGFRISD